MPRPTSAAEFMQLRGSLTRPKEPVKNVRYVTSAKLKPASIKYPNHEGMAGKFVLECRVVIDIEHPSEVNKTLITSPVIRVDVNSSTFETKQTIYILIPESEVETYQMIYS